MYYEALYYLEEERMNPVFYEFKTKKQALKFYEKHKKDDNKFGWWITKRNKDGEVIEDIIY